MVWSLTNTEEKLKKKSDDYLQVLCFSAYINTFDDFDNV